MFCRFWGVSACACNFLLRNSRYEFSRENQYPRGWSSEKQLCSVDFEVYLRARATFFSETADLVKTAVFWRFWGVSTCSCNFLLRNCRLTNSRGRIPVWEDDLVKKQLCSVDFEVNLRARATFFSETADLVKTAVFWQFWGVLVQLSSQKQQTYEFSRENPYRRGWSSEKQLCSVDFEVYLRARATFFSETADLVKTAVFWRFWGVSTCSCNFLLRNSRLTSSRGRIPIREDDLVKSSYVLTILRCIYMLVQLSSQKQQTYEFSRGNPFPRRWSSEYSYVPMILRCIYMLVQLSSQKQRIFDFSRENPYPRGWSSEKQLCSVDFEVYLRARATFFSETADLVKTAVFWRFWGVSTCSCNFLLRNSRLTSCRWRIPIREDDLVKNSCVLRILRCICVRVQLFSQKQRI